MINKLKSNQRKYLFNNDKQTKKQSTEVFINMCNSYIIRKII